MSGSTSCSPCLVGYYCLLGSTRADQYTCSNATKYPTEHYCPAGSAHPLNVPANYYSTPDSKSTLYTRTGIELCEAQA